MSLKVCAAHKYQQHYIFNMTGILFHISPQYIAKGLHNNTSIQRRTWHYWQTDHPEQLSPLSTGYRLDENMITLYAVTAAMIGFHQPVSWYKYEYKSIKIKFANIFYKTISVPVYIFVQYIRVFKKIVHIDGKSLVCCCDLLVLQGFQRNKNMNI